MQKFYKIDTRSARTVKRRMFINIIIICSKYYYSNMVALIGIHENVMLSNLLKNNVLGNGSVGIITDKLH